MKTLVISSGLLSIAFILFLFFLLVGIALIHGFSVAKLKTKVRYKVIWGVFLLVIALAVAATIVWLWVNYPPRHIKLFQNEVALLRTEEDLYKFQSDATVFTNGKYIIFPNNAGIFYCDVKVKLSLVLQKMYKNQSVVFTVYFNYSRELNEYYSKIVELAGPDGRFTENLYHKVSAYADKYELTGKDCSWEMEMQKYLSPYVEKLGPQ
ncbi:MAG: hypothetical protein HY973_01300, partial [Candidatus Kerfeldbacteria bacterium]|nr:hypothetical protein [Candidatus Kerfeldbacteria bacterium]